MRRRGFTLIELLLTILLLGMLIAGAWAGITTATKAARSGEALIDRTNRVRVAQEFIRRQIRNALALPYPVDKSTGETRTFEGDADVILRVELASRPAERHRRTYSANAPCGEHHD